MEGAASCSLMVAPVAGVGNRLKSGRPGPRLGSGTSYSRHATGGIVSRRAYPPLGRGLQLVCLGVRSFGQSLVGYRGLPDGASGLSDLGERLLVFSVLVVLFSLPRRAHCSSCP